MARFFRWMIVVTVIGAAITYGALRGKAGNSEAKPLLSSAEIRMGGLVATIGATGTIEPEDLINVGAQVAGRILEFGKDKQGRSIDYGSVIEAGMVLAHIDDVLYRSELAQAEAQVHGSKADLEYARISLKQAQAKHDLAQRDWTRAQRLGVSEGLSQANFDNYRSTCEIADINLQMARVAIEQAQAKLEQSQATLDRASKNLGFCTIQSPVKGVIIDRRVNIGQTVVASLSAPSLFLIAKDLTRVQIWVAVNEADIGSIRPGQPVTFTVDAFPDETFHGKVSKIRLNATMTSNVVTYTVEVTTENPSGRLMPYLTANVNFEVARRDKVLLAPIDALKWTPADEVRKAYGLPPEPETQNGDAPSAGAGQDATPAHSPRGEVWTLAEDGALRAVPVKLGINDGLNTEVSGEALKDGMRVITGMQENTPVASQAGKNPFVPKPPAGRNGKTAGPPI